MRRLEAQYNVTLLTTENIGNLKNWGIQSAQNLLGATVNGLALVAAMYIMLWFMLSEGKWSVCCTTGCRCGWRTCRTCGST